MATSTITIPLPEGLQAFVEARVSGGDFPSMGDYVRDLILEDRTRLREALEARLLKAMESESIEVPIDEIEPGELHLFLIKKLEERKLSA